MRLVKGSPSLRESVARMRLGFTALIGAVICAAFIAGAARAQDALTVQLTDLDHSQFPTVSGRLSISDSFGVAVPPDTVGDISVSEDSSVIVTVPPTPVQVPENAVILVLVVDTGGQSSDTLANVTEVVGELLGVLTEHDRAVLVSFSSESTDNASPMIPRTHDFALVQEAVAGLSSQDRTPLYSAAVAGINAVTDISAGRKVVVLIGDGRAVQALESLKRDEVIERAVAEHVRLHTIGVAPAGGLNEINLKQLSELTAGGYWVPGDTVASYAVALAGEIGSLKTEYEFSYESQIHTSGSHALTFAATSAGSSGVAEGSISPIETLRAVPINLADGTVLESAVEIIPAIGEGFAVDRVRYLIDGEEVAAVDSAPFSFNLDPQSISPGEHLLLVRLESALHGDSQTGAIFHVAALAAPSVDFSDGAVLDSPREIVAVLSENADVDTVRFLVDLREIGVLTAPPYTVSLTPGDLPPGDHELIVRVEDSVHGENETSVTFITPGLPPPLVTPGSGVSIDVPTQITASAPPGYELLAVEFWLNGERVARSESAPFSYLIEPLEHVPGELTFQVIGSGSFDQRSTTDVVVHILPLPEPTIDLPSGEALDSDVPVTIAVDTGYAVTRLDVFIDDREIQSFAAPPYQFQVPSGDLDDGEHVLRVVASSGDVRESSVSIPFTVAGQLLWLWIALGASAAALSAISLAIFGLRVRGRRRTVTRVLPEPMFQISVSRAGELLRRVDLRPGMLIVGRAEESDIQLIDDVYVSRRHAALHVSEEEVFIEDFRATNPSIVDGREIPPLRRTLVEPGTAVEIGDFVLALELTMAADSVATDADGE